MDFLHGTVLVPWLHGLLRKKHQGNDFVNSAIISGDLRISDALPVYKDVAGLPVPFVLEKEKVDEDKEDKENKQDDQEPCTLIQQAHSNQQTEMWQEHDPCTWPLSIRRTDQ